MTLQDHKGRECDPASGLPYGTIIRNAKGDFGMIVREGVLPLTQANVDQILREWPSDQSASGKWIELLKPAKA